LLFSVLGDIGLARVLRKSDKPFLGPRLIADSLDSAIWSQIPTDDVELAVLPGVPLAFEAGYRYGVGGMVTPVTAAAATFLLQRVRKKRVTLAPFRWQLLASSAGIATAMLETRHRDEVLGEADTEEEARTYRAWLAGQNDVAMGADSVVDDLCRISPLLGDEVTDNAIGPMVRAWKQALATKTETGAVYLGNVLAQWQRRHNDFQHDLSHDVWFDIVPGDGIHILTAKQAQWLAAACDRLTLRGQVSVSVDASKQGNRPGRPLDVRLAQMRVEVPPDDDQGVTPLDLGSLGLAAFAYWVFESTTSRNAQCARWVGWPIAAANLYGAAWAQRQVRRGGAQSHGAILTFACATSIAQAVASSLTIRQPENVQGKQRLPFLTGLNVVGMMLPLYWRDLDRNQRTTVISGLAATVGLGMWLYPERISKGDLARELLWAVAASWATARLRRSFEESADGLETDLAEKAERAEERAFGEGRSFVIQLVSDAVMALQNQLGGSVDLDMRLRAEVERRLHGVGKRMKELTA